MCHWNEKYSGINFLLASFLNCAHTCSFWLTACLLEYLEVGSGPWKESPWGQLVLSGQMPFCCRTISNQSTEENTWSTDYSCERITDWISFCLEPPASKVTDTVLFTLTVQHYTTLKSCVRVIAAWVLANILQQVAIIEKCDHLYTGRWWTGCCLYYSEEEHECIAGLRFIWKVGIQIFGQGSIRIFEWCMSTLYCNDQETVLKCAKFVQIDSNILNICAFRHSEMSAWIMLHHCSILIKIIKQLL